MSLRLVHLPTALFVAVFAMLALSAPLSAQQTYTWDGGAGGTSGSWGNATNWVDDPSPLTFTNTTDIIFSQSAMTTNTIWTFLGGANRTIRSLTFGTNLVGNTNLFDVRLLETSSSGSTARNLVFSADSGNASITVAQSTSGVSQIRLGNGSGGSIVLDSNLDLVQNNTFLTANVAFQLANQITGTGTINKTGAGRVGLNTGNSGWSGGMNINEGEVMMWGNANVMGTGTWSLGGGTNNTRLTVGSTLTYTNPGGLVVGAGDGTRTIANSAVNPGAPTLGGAITLSNDVIFDITNHASGNNTLTVSGAIVGTDGIIKTGTGLLQLSGANTYAGDTVLLNGNIQAMAANSLSATSVVRFGATNSGRRLHLQGFDQTVGGVDSTAATGGTLTVQAAADSVNNASATLTLDVAAGQSYDFTGFVRNAAGGATNSALTLVKNGAGTQVLSGSNNQVSYSGTTTVNAGVLEFGGVDTVANNSAMTVNAGGTVRFSGGGTRSNTIGGSGNLEKTGANTLTLSGNNSYTGTTTVSAGSLIVNGNQSAATGVLDVASGATLGGSGTIGGATTISGILAPGNSAGLLTFNSSLTLSDTATTVMEINGFADRGTDFDAINVGGLLTYDGTLTLSLGTTFGNGSYNFDLFDFASTAGSFDTVDLAGNYSGSLTTNNAGIWGLTSVTGSLTNTWTFTESSGVLALEVVPEPSTYALLALAAAGLGAHIVRRRRMPR